MSNFFNLHETYAGRECTIDALFEAGFQIDQTAPKPFSMYDADVITVCHTLDKNQIAAAYQCASGYYCVAIYDRRDTSDLGWMAPIIWNGPRASWDLSNPLEDFTAYVEAYLPDALVK